MVDFDNISERAEAERKQQQEWRQKNEELILAMAEEYRMSHGKAAFLQHKNMLTDLILELDDAVSNLRKDLIEPLSQNADQATEEEQVALTGLQADLQEYVRNVFYYSKIQSGFDSKNVDETLRKEREYTDEIQSLAKKINEGFDKAMMYASSDTDVFLKVQALSTGIQRIFTSMTNGLLPEEYDAISKDPKPTHIDGKKAHYIDATGDKAPEVGKEATEAVIKRLDGYGYKDIKLNTRTMGQPLFTHDPCPEDVYQGCLGDCYFVSSLAAVAAASPEMIKDMIHLSDDGKKATVRLYNHQNEPVFVTVDAIEHVATCKKDGNDETVEIFARGASWVKLIERAFAASMLHRTPEDKNIDQIRAERFKDNEKKKPVNERSNLSDDEIAQITADRNCKEVEDGDEKGSYSHIIGGENEETLQTLFGEEASKYLKDKNLASTIYCESGDEGKYYDETEKRKTPQEKIDEEQQAYEKKEQENKEISAFIRLNKHNGLMGTAVLSKIKEGQALTAQLEKEKTRIDSLKEAVENGKTIYTTKELEFFNKVKEARDKGCVMTAGSRRFKDTKGKFDVTMEQFYETYKGLPLHHSYSVVDYREDTKTGKKYIKVRDPHNQGGRAYDETDKSYYDIDPERAGESEVELTDFIATFRMVTKMEYGDKTITGMDIAAGKEMKELYGDALRDLCGQLKHPGNFYGLIDRDSKFNGLKTSLNTLGNVLQKKDARKPEIENCLKEVFREAKKYRDYCNGPDQVKKMNKLSGDKADRAANRFFLAEMVGQLEVSYNANQEKQKPERVTGYELQKNARDRSVSASPAKDFTVRVIDARMAALQAKEQKLKDKQLNNLEKQKKDVLKACQKLQSKGTAADAEIERALAVMMYYDDITKDSKNLSATVLEKKLKKSVVQEEMKFSAKNMKDTIKEMIAARECSSAADFLNKVGSANAVTAIRTHWDAKTKALMDEINAPARNNATAQNKESVQSNEPAQNNEPAQKNNGGAALGSL